MKIFALVGISASVTSLVQAASIAQCDVQAGCIAFSVTELVGEGTCNGTPCKYQVCMTITQDGDCIKTDAISHSCKKPEDVCSTPGSFDVPGVVSISPTNGDVQCQIAGGGEKVQFMLKDGSEEDCLSGHYQVNDELVYCGDVWNDGIPSCSGAGTATKECYWEYTLPSCEHDEEVTTEMPVTTAPPPTTTAAATTEAATTEADAVTTTPPPLIPSGGGGDPHFQRWGLEHDSFHGECDLVMVHSEQFHNGAGFDLHARTTIESYFSYIETAALRVGDNTLQFAKGHFFLNGESYTPGDLPMTFGEEFKYTITNAEVEANKNAKFYQYYKVDLQEDSSVLFKFYKKFLTIDIAGSEKDFADAVGLLGQYHTGAMLSRDGVEFTSFEAFGFEWQVSPEDPALFLNQRSPQLPYEMCRMPTAARPSRRHLRADRALMDSAKQACSHVNGGSHDLCVDDIMTTGDAGLGALW